MSRSQRGRLIVLALPFLGGPTLRRNVQRGAVGVAAGHVPLDRLAHVQHAAQRVYVLAPQRPQRGRARVRPTQNEWAPSPLHGRGLDRVRLHADLTILAKLARTLASASRPARRLAAVERPPSSFLNRRLRGVGPGRSRR
jgi:hypothetical protein